MHTATLLLGSLTRKPLQPASKLMLGNLLLWLKDSCVVHIQTGVSVGSPHSQ